MALAAAELLVRTFAPQQLVDYRSDIYEATDSLRFQQRPNLHTTINTGERTVSLHTDSNGFRVGTRGRITAARNILVIGDSFMQALQVDYEQSLSGLLETRLPHWIGEPVSIRNVSVATYSPIQYSILTRRWLAREPFDLVLAAVTLENDEVPTHVVFPPRLPHIDHPLHVPNTVSLKGFVSAVLYPINDALEIRSHLFILARHAFQLTLMHLGLSPLPLPIWYYRNMRESPVWDSTAVLLEEVAKAADEHHVPIMYVLLPSSFQVDSADFGRYVRGFGVDPDSVDLEQPNRLIGDALRQRGRAVFDATSILRAATQRGIRTHGRFDIHLSPEGQALTERLVEPEIVRMLRPLRDSSSSAHATPQ